MKINILKIGNHRINFNSDDTGNSSKKLKTNDTTYALVIANMI